MNWFHELFLNPGTSFWRYLLRVSAATFSLSIPISYLLAHLLPNIYPDFDPGLLSVAAAGEALVFYGVLGPALFVLLAFLATPNLISHTDNIYTVALVITGIAALITTVMTDVGFAIATAWPFFACSLAYQVGLKTSLRFAALSGGGVMSLYNLAGLGLHVLLR